MREFPMLLQLLRRDVNFHLNFDVILYLDFGDMFMLSFLRLWCHFLVISRIIEFPMLNNNSTTEIHLLVTAAGGRPNDKSNKSK